MARTTFFRFTRWSYDDTTEWVGAQMHIYPRTIGWAIPEVGIVMVQIEWPLHILCNGRFFLRKVNRAKKARWCKRSGTHSTLFTFLADPDSLALVKRFMSATRLALPFCWQDPYSRPIMATPGYESLTFIGCLFFLLLCNICSIWMIYFHYCNVSMLNVECQALSFGHSEDTPSWNKKCAA